MALGNERVTALLDEFFDVQAEWQSAAERAAPAIAGLAEKVEIVMLTAMPHRHRDRRRAHLDALGFPYPLLTTEKAKGPAIRQLRGDQAPPGRLRRRHSAQPCFGADDRADAHLFHLMMHPEFRAMLPPLPEGIAALENWDDGVAKIAAALGIEAF